MIRLPGPSPRFSIVPACLAAVFCFFNVFRLIDAFSSGRVWADKRYHQRYAELATDPTAFYNGVGTIVIAIVFSGGFALFLLRQWQNR